MDTCFTVILIYIDDLLIIDTHMIEISHLKQVIYTKLNI